jgi:hypothetical protein
MKKVLAGNLILKILILNLFFFNEVKAAGLNSPALFSTAKPWTYWWWPGSAVNEKGITYQLEAYAKAGFGGLHIIPIYGAKGFEKEFIPYLSPQWQHQFLFVLKEAKRLHLGIDMTLGTGWPFGGPQISPIEAAKSYKIDVYNLKKGEKIPEIPISLANTPGSNLVSVALFDENEFVKELFSKQFPKSLHELVIEKPNQKLYVVYQTLTKQMVKRAAPGGEGLVMDHFSQKAFETYQKPFLNTLQKASGHLRAIYNDSYEAFGANWTGELLNKFQELNGYDLRTKWNVLAKDKAENEEENQIWADYHRTISHLVQYDFTKNFHQFALQNGVQSRDQAHGSPGNLLDLYSEVAIPESEFFGSKPYPIPGYRIDPDYDSTTFGIPDIKIIKLASSAAHFYGKKLVTSETATWLGNHFKVSLAQVKPVVDEVMLGGVNHLFFHGATYSPPEVKWPGWLFYASTNFNYNSHFWSVLPELNGYIERCQSRLQNAKSDADIMLYFPMEDIWHKGNGKGKLHTMELHANSRIWMKNTPFAHWANLFQQNGFQADYVSDEMLSKLKLNPNKTFTSPGGQTYKILFLPAVDFLSLQTFELVSKWIQMGYPVYFLEHWPQNRNTWNWSENLQLRWENAKEHVMLRVLGDPRDALKKHGITHEEGLSSAGLSYFRKKSSNGYVYFVANLSSSPKEGTIRLSKINGFYKVVDPLHQKETYGKIDSKLKNLFLRLEPGETVFIEQIAAQKIVPQKVVNDYFFKELDLKGPIAINFTKGSPSLPNLIQLEKPTYWTLDTSTHYFSGQGVYKIHFQLDSASIAQAKFLHCTDIRDWAQVKLNGKSLGTIWSIPFKLEIQNGLLQTENELELAVNNVSANYVRLLDQQKVNWKNFYEINFVDIRYKPFDASKWPVEPAGFAGKLFVSNR